MHNVVLYVRLFMCCTLPEDRENPEWTGTRGRILLEKDKRTAVVSDTTDFLLIWCKL